jgi:hypothetical protein
VFRRGVERRVGVGPDESVRVRRLDHQEADRLEKCHLKHLRFLGYQKRVLVQNKLDQLQMIILSNTQTGKLFTIDKVN